MTPLILIYAKLISISPNPNSLMIPWRVPGNLLLGVFRDPWIDVLAASYRGVRPYSPVLWDESPLSFAPERQLSKVPVLGRLCVGLRSWHANTLGTNQD